MIEQKTFGQKVIEFNKKLSKTSMELPDGFKIINPFNGSQKEIVGFLYDVIEKYGGCKKFYSDFYMNFVCPVGIVRINSKGNEVNCNYYDSKKLQETLYSLIVSSIQTQIDFGIDTSVCYCIGSGDNYTFLSKINKEYNFFDEIIPLEHPRFIMQYNSKHKYEYFEKYLTALKQNHNKEKEIAYR